MHEQEPRGPFLGANWFPTELLAGLNPRACVSAEVFRYPDKQGQTEKAKQEWHFPVFLIRAKIDLRAPISNEDADDQAPADIEGKVVGEEIEVGEFGQKYRDSELGQVIKTQFKPSPYTCGVATDCRIHEAREQEHISPPHHRFARVSSAPDRIVRFKELYRCGQDVNDCDDSELADTFQSSRDQPDRNANGVDEEEIVVV